ncbi:ATP-binding cassette subfamily B protein [Lachnotalea glycerini]|uniref:ATP-binding cassette subfamily B protein n=1 Tax=Lachnotalea glycerini TaxID=1763509 RepID=A0A318ETA7_9FIRM|nr:ABC transporter ATP-binding protein [Lachnotalea glycerini]PXV91807.1 ATP-binding cassette subfamily B protein [Lachnotalea glycerini]
MTPLKWFYSHLRKHAKYIITGLIIIPPASALAVINPKVSGAIVDLVIKEKNVELLPKLILLLVVTTLFRSGIRFVMIMSMEKASQGMLYSLRDSVYKRLLLQDFNFYNKNRTGDLMSRQTGDMDAIRHFVAHVIYAVVESIFIFAFALIMMFTVNLKIALFMILVLPFTALTTYFQVKNIKPVFIKSRVMFSRLNAFAQENISGNRVVKAFAKEDFETEKFDLENENFRAVQLEGANIWAKYIPIFEFLSNILTLILMLPGAIMVINGQMTLGNMVTISGYLWMLTTPLRTAGWLINDIQRFLTSLEKIYSTISHEPDIKRPENAVVKKHLSGSVRFENVSYQAEDEDILNQVNFEIKAGQTVGIIGATGAGKSTMMNLLCRFYDTTEGNVYVDNINVKDMDLFSLRQNIGMAMQDVFLFSDTIEGNIAYGRPDCSFEEVEWAAKAANADLFIKMTTDGYDTIVGERGMGLSGGQKQRISLARALLTDPAIIILDDTTSAVDMETETRIQEELNKLQNKKTVFIIAHRISSIKDADIILVLNEGRVVEQGTHDELIRKRGYYYTVFSHQYGEFDRLKDSKDFKEYVKEKKRGAACYG